MGHADRLGVQRSSDGYTAKHLASIIAAIWRGGGGGGGGGGGEGGGVRRRGIGRSNSSGDLWYHYSHGN